MKTSLLIGLTCAVALVASSAAASPACQALATKISAGFQAAHQMSPADRTAKCRAYALVIHDMDDVGLQCRSPDDHPTIQTTIKPIAKAIHADEQQFCGR